MYIHTGVYIYTYIHIGVAYIHVDVCKYTQVCMYTHKCVFVGVNI